MANFPGNGRDDPDEEEFGWRPQDDTPFVPRRGDDPDEPDEARWRGDARFAQGRSGARDDRDLRGGRGWGYRAGAGEDRATRRGERYWEDRAERMRGRVRSHEDRGYRPESHGVPGGYGGGAGWEAERLGPRGYGYDEDRPFPDRAEWSERTGEPEERRSRIRSRTRGPVARRESYRGLGPAGFRRTDERIRELVCEALTDDPDVDATHVEVTVKNGDVTLAGSVRDRAQRWFAEDCTAGVAGVREIQNQLRVGSWEPGGRDRER